MRKAGHHPIQEAAAEAMCEIRVAQANIEPYRQYRGNFQGASGVIYLEYLRSDRVKTHFDILWTFYVNQFR